MPKTTSKAKTTKTTKTASAKNSELSEVLELIKQIKKENDDLKQELQDIKAKNNIDSATPVTATLETVEDENSMNRNIARLIENLSNSRSNREVTIVHNAELLGGLVTVMTLSGVDITLSKLGEQRSLSWAQFEEMCSKYRGFLDRGIIQLPPAHRDLCDKYQIQCFETKDGNIKLTLSDLQTIGDLSTEELENFFVRLSKADKHTLLDYWLGKCYARPEERDTRFYNRYKLELLNRVSESFVFDNIIADMNCHS